MGAAVVAAGAVLVAYALSRSAAPKPETMVAKVTHIEDTVLASGTIQPSKLVSIGAQASGRIVALQVSLGDHVAKGQLIAEIDPATQRNALQAAEATLDQERAQRDSRAVALKQAELAFKRAQSTYPQEAISQADYEAAEATYNGARADVAALDAQIRQAVIAVDTARVNLGYTRVVAPIEGTVVAIVALEGQTVNAVQSAPTIVKLADLSTMTVKVQISEADVIRVHSGQRVYFSILGAPERHYDAKLRTVEPAPEAMSAESPTTAGAGSGGSASNSAIYYNGLFEIANTDQVLRPSMTAQASIVLQEADDAIVIPATTLGARLPDGRRLIDVLDAEGHVRPRPVRVGISDRVNVQILDGLQVGERVVVVEAAKTH